MERLLLIVLSLLSSSASGDGSAEATDAGAMSFTLVGSCLDRFTSLRVVNSRRRFRVSFVTSTLDVRIHGWCAG